MHARALKIDAAALRKMSATQGWNRGSEIAQGLGLSESTISRVLRGHPVGGRFIAGAVAAFGPAAYGLFRGTES